MQLKSRVDVWTHTVDVTPTDIQNDSFEGNGLNFLPVDKELCTSDSYG